MVVYISLIIPFTPLGIFYSVGTNAEKYALTLISFDKDFDKTDRGRKTPQELLN